MAADQYLTIRPPSSMSTPAEVPQIVQMQRAVVELWADGSTDANSPRYADLVRDKSAALLAEGTTGAMGFFPFTGKRPGDVSELDVKAWRVYLENQELSPSSIYAKVSRLSAFFNWALDPQSPAYGMVARNPVTMSRPKAPKAYQNDSTQALTDAQVKALMRVIRADADALPVDLGAKRDYALLRFYFATGKRRAEIVQLVGSQLRFAGAGLVIRPREKGGKYRATEITDPGVKAALVAYLKASGRWDFGQEQPVLADDEPLWMRHDRAAKPDEHGKLPGVSSHGFVKAFKQYALRAGLGDVHLHQTRHTVADVIGNEYGDVAAAQTVLGHENQQTTREYLKTVAVKKDCFSSVIADRYGFDHE